MLVVKAICDGKKILLPERESFPSGTVIVVFNEKAKPEDVETGLWLKIQEKSFNKAWDNKEDAIYDTL